MMRPMTVRAVSPTSLLTVAAAIASAAVLVGVVASCSAPDREAPAPASAAQPASVISTAPSDRAAADNQATAGTGAAQRRAPGMPEPDLATDAAEHAGSGPGSAGTANAPAGTGRADPTGMRTPDPEDLSTGPALHWTELDPDFADLYGFEATGDGRVIARAWPGGDGRTVGGDRVVVTANGADWEELPLPDRLIPAQIDVAGDRWLVIGWYPDFDAPESRLDRAFFSDDRGATWTELEFDIPADPALASPYLQEHLWSTPALVSGERMVLVLQGYVTLDARSLLADAGLMPEGREVLGWQDAASGTVVFDLRDPLETDPKSPDFETQRLEATLDQLGLTEDEWRELNGPHDDTARIFAGDRSSLEFAARYAGWVPIGTAGADGFALVLQDGPTERILTSADGLVWSEGQPFDYDYSMRTVAAGGTIWRTAPQPPGSFSVQRAADGEAPATVATFEGLHPTGMLAAGPSGLALTAFWSLEGQLEEGAIAGLPVWRDADRMGQPTEVPLWLGWSANGTDWGWQSLPGTLGITEGEPWAHLGVGRDFVIARVETMLARTAEEIASWRDSPSAYAELLALEAPPLRWFIGRVP